jgi:hypothetical protein
MPLGLLGVSMQLSLTPQVAALLLMTACAGEVTAPPDELASPRDGRADAGMQLDARGPRETPDDDEPLEPSEISVPDVDAGEQDVDGCGRNGENSPALGLRVREVSLYQAIKVGLYSGGAWKQQSATTPVIEGRRSLVRVLSDTLPGYVAHPVRAVLTLKKGDKVTRFEDERTLSASSSEAQLASGFSFDVPGANIGAGSELSVRLEELSCTEQAGQAADTRVPASGTQALDTLAVGKLRVVLVPVSVNGRLPVTDEAELEKMKAALQAYYPVPDVDLTVHKALIWDGPIAGTDSDAWEDVLTQIMQLRRNDKVESDVYYFGLVQPAATFAAYCRGGCILGLAPQTVQVTPSQQVGMGASFADEQTYDTMVHELGHAHGRGHSPCVKRGATIQGLDKSYPDAAGATVSWGWDSRKNLLMPPTTHEIMGYCDPPSWVSEYNYNAFAARSSKVNLKALVRGAGSGHWEHVVVYGSGRARWGGSHESERPGGEVELAAVLDASGRVLEHVEVVRIPLSHSPGTFLYVPKPLPGWAALQLRDRTLTLSEILPAR